jgi:cysteine synthase
MQQDQKGTNLVSKTLENDDTIRIEYEQQVKSYLEQIGAPFYDHEKQQVHNETPIVNVTDLMRNFSKHDYMKKKENLKNIYLKEEYANPFTRSVKGRAVAAMVLSAVRSGSIFAEGPDGKKKKKRWIEPTSGNTGKGLAEIARLLGIEYTSVFSRLDVADEIKAYHARFGARILNIGAEYPLAEIEALARRHHKKVAYYWANTKQMSEDSKELLFKKKKLEAMEKVNGESTNVDSRDLNASPQVALKEIEGKYLLEEIVPVATQALRTPLISRVEKGEFDQLKKSFEKHIPELRDPFGIMVAFLCPVGNVSIALNMLLSQLGFANVCSVKGGIESIRNESLADGNTTIESTAEYCPLPGASISNSSIDYVKKLVSENSDDYFTFNQYENIENVNAHVLTTGPELLSQIRDLGTVMCTFGTGGTATGLATFFKERGVQVYVAFPKNPVEGIRTLRGSEKLAFFKPELYQGIVEVSNTKTWELLKFFLKNQLKIGPSTAVALQAALDLSMNDDGSCAVIAADCIENYHSEYHWLLDSCHN